MEQTLGGAATALVAIDSARRELEALVSAESASLDVTQLLESLSLTGEFLAHASDAETCARILRSDLTERITAMERAMQVATQSSREELIENLAALERCSAAELVQCQRRTCARFRDVFPGASAFTGGSAGTPRDWTEYRTNLNWE